MTTLPQTTNVRLPRPVSGGMQLAGPGGHLAAPAGAAQPAGGANDALRVIRAHIWMILIMLVLSAVAGWGLNEFLARNYPKYTATGLVEVRPAVDPNQANKAMYQPFDPGQVALEIRTQAQYLRHEGLLIRLLTNNNSPIRNTSWFRQFDKRPDTVAAAKADFEDCLSVTPILDTKLVRVEFTYSKPEDCKAIVQDLVETHLNDQKTQAVNSLLDRTAMLNQLRIKTEMSIRTLTDQMKEKQVKLNLDGGGIGKIGLKELELSRLVQDLVEARSKQVKSRAIFEGAQNALQNGQDPPMTEAYLNQGAPHLLNLQLNLKNVQIQYEVQKQRMGADHPQSKALAKQLELMEKDYQQTAEEARAKARMAAFEALKGEKDADEARVENLNTQINNLKQDLGELSNAMVQYYTMDQEVRGLREQLKDVKQNIDNVMAVNSQNTAARVAWYALPEVPKNRSFPKLQWVMGLSIAVGLALSLLIAFLREAMDQSIRSPRDIAKIGQIQLLGIVPDENDDPQAAGARLPVVIFDAPHSVMAEHFRHVRTRLQHSASLDTMRSIMVTSPSPGDGKTTVACNIAAGLALNGRRILLVDANFRRPEVHKVFGVANEQGFSDVLNAVVAFDEVIQETQVPNLAVMASGPKPMNPTELFESQLLIDFIERALEEFDHVVFDSGPLMVVAEAQAMAPRVDGVVSVVRARTNNRGLLQRMRDELRRVKAEHLGVVLNAVRAQGGGYYGRNIKTYYDYANNG